MFQCPASFKPEKNNIINLTKFFTTIKRKDYIFVWKPRGTWPASIIEGLCKELDLNHCVEPFTDTMRFGQCSYFRLHGISGFRYQYTLADLHTLRTYCQARKRTYILFNNISMVDDAERFKVICTDRISSSGE